MVTTPRLPQPGDFGVELGWATIAYEPLRSERDSWGLSSMKLGASSLPNTAEEPVAA